MIAQIMESAGRMQPEDLAKYMSDVNQKEVGSYTAQAHAPSSHTHTPCRQESISLCECHTF